jgi:hypothetical protein
VSQGSVYVFTRSGTAWSQQKKLTAADGAADDGFGSSVSISGESAVVGAPYDDVDANVNQGSAYVFTRSGVTWSQQAQLTAADGVDLERFGNSVAISGETAVVGADPLGGWIGSAYVFARSGVTWSEQAQLAAADGDFFGTSVAISADTVVVGAERANGEQGSAYVFTRSGTAWSQQKKLTAAVSTDPQKCFGGSVALSGETAVVGAEYEDIGVNFNQGSAYVFLFSDLAAPGKPVAKSPKGLISSRTPTFRWAASARAATYEVRIYRGSKLIRKKTGIAKTSWRCTNPLPRKVWLTWKVRARNVAGLGLWSARLRFKVR